MMIFNLCLLLTAYCVILEVSGEKYEVGKTRTNKNKFILRFNKDKFKLRFNIREICEYMRTIYELIYPAVDLKLELDFGKNSPDLYLYGKGTVVFSPYMSINHCRTDRRNGTTVINVLVNDILTIQFERRPWVVVEDCEIQIYISRASIINSDDINIKILSISIADFRIASANCEQDEVRPEEVKFLLNGALAKCSLVGKTFKVTRKSSPESALTRLSKNVFKYYMSKLTTDDSTFI